MEPLREEKLRSPATLFFEDGMAASLLGGCFGDLASYSGPLETQGPSLRWCHQLFAMRQVPSLIISCCSVTSRAFAGRGSLHPHILLCLIGHDLTDRLSAILDRGAQGHLVIELERWSQSVKAAAERIRYDSQLTLAGQLGQSSDALPLSERQRQSAGAHYGDLPTQAVEPDGHEVRWTAAGCSGDLTLTGSYTTLRPIYLRRSSGLSSDAWKKSLVEDYRRLVIQNHYHRCTKSCHKNNLKKKRVGCRRGV